MALATDVADSMDMDRGVWHVTTTNKALQNKVNRDRCVCRFENIVKVGQGPACRTIESQAMLLWPGEFVQHILLPSRFSGAARTSAFHQASPSPVTDQGN